MQIHKSFAGQFMKLQINSTSVLTLSEVEVYN